MDEESQRTLTHLIRAQRVAALGTLRQNAPFVSMVLCAPAPDFSAFFIHISRLAHHTQDILQDARVGLMIAQADDGSQDPQTLARVSLQGEAVELPAADAEHATAKVVYLERFPLAAFNFGLGDFALFRIAPKTARYVAGFGRYVGTEEEADDGVPFAEKMNTLTVKLAGQFAKGAELEKTIRENLKGIGYEF